MQFLMKLANNRFLRWVLALAWTIYLTVLLLQPELQPLIPTGIPPAPPSFEREVFFTIAHFSFFGFTALLWCFALEKELSPFMVLLIVALLLICYCFVTEFAQATVPGRTVQITDILANIGGMLLGLAFFRWQDKQNWHWRIR